MTDQLSLSWVMNFGKHKGLTLLDALTEDPSYIEWCLKNVEWFRKAIESNLELEEKINSILYKLKEDPDREDIRDDLGNIDED